MIWLGKGFGYCLVKVLIIDNALCQNLTFMTNDNS
jgi:hypothetical protein